MAYRFERGEPLAEGVRRVAREQLAGAVESLGRETERDEAIHDVRKRVKKTRALLRLVRPELGEIYAAENMRLRDAGRALARFRDAAVAVETFDDVYRKFQEEVPADRFKLVRRRLAQRKTRAGRSASLGTTVAEVSAVLDACSQEVSQWPLAAEGFALIAPGLQQTFRRGCKAMEAARCHSQPEDFHEWRKQVKDHWYHIRLLEGVWSEMMGGLERSLKQLEDWLGTDHNLEVLRARVTPAAGRGAPAAGTDALLLLICRYQKELRERALDMGERIYSERPGHFCRRMERLWEAWQR